MNYIVSPMQVEDDFVWEVIENKTQQTIDTFFFEEEASDLAKFLETGGGFDGWTPSFMLLKVVNKNNINHEFEAFLDDML